MSLQCIHSAVKQANIKLPASTGIFIGSTIGESEAFERAANDSTIDCSKQTVYSWSKKLKKEFGYIPMKTSLEVFEYYMLSRLKKRMEEKNHPSHV